MLRTALVSVKAAVLVALQASRLIKKPKIDEPVTQWFAADGDATYRLNYPLSERSVVVDVGRYMGDWTAAIVDKFKPQIFVFEPVAQFNRHVMNRFRSNPCVHVHPYGLGAESRADEIAAIGDRSTLYRTGGSSEVVTIRRADDVFFGTGDLRH